MADKKPIDSSTSEEDRRKKRNSFLKQLATLEDAAFLERVSKVPQTPISSTTLKGLKTPGKFNPTLNSGTPTDIANNLFETSLADVVKDTTYGTETDTELAKARDYATANNIPMGHFGKRFNVAVNPGRGNFAIIGRDLVSLDPKQPMDDDNKQDDVINGWRRLRNNTEGFANHLSGFDRFEDTNTPVKMRAQDLVEHEGSHQAYGRLATKILPQTTTPEKPQSTPYWTQSDQLYGNSPYEMANFLMAIQRDQYTTTGSRFEKPEDFEKDMLEIMSSADPEKAMDEKGYNRADARRGIRSIIASPRSMRRKMIRDMSKVVPSLAKNEEFSGGLLS